MLSEASYSNSCNGLAEFLPYALDYMPEDLQRRAKSELGEDEETREKALKLFRERLKGETDIDFPDKDDGVMIIACLRARKFDVERALTLFKNCFKCTRKRSEIFYNYDFELVRKTITEIDVGILPYRDKEGCLIYIIRTERWIPSNPGQTLGDVTRALAAGLIHATLYPATQVAGFKVIFDFKGLKLSHLPHFSPTYLWLLVEAIQNAFPARFKAIHVVNINPLVSYLWMFFKSIMSKKMIGRVHFHEKSVTNKDLHKLFDAKILPAEYDGELPPFREVNKEWIRLMAERQNDVAQFLSCGYWKSKPVTPDELKKAKKEIKKLNIK